MLGGKKQIEQRKSLRDCPSFRKKRLSLRFTSFFHFTSSLFVSRSLSSPLRPRAELLLKGHDCRLASRLISLLTPLSHSWLTNTKMEDVLPVFKCSKLKRSQRKRGKESVKYFQSVCICCSSTWASESFTWSTRRKRNVPFRKHVTQPLV